MAEDKKPHEKRYGDSKKPEKKTEPTSAPEGDGEHAEGADVSPAMDAHASMVKRHLKEARDLHGQHRDALKDMHGRHEAEMKDMLTNMQQQGAQPGGEPGAAAAPADTQTEAA